MTWRVIFHVSIYNLHSLCQSVCLYYILVLSSTCLRTFCQSIFSYVWNLVFRGFYSGRLRQGVNALWKLLRKFKVETACSVYHSCTVSFNKSWTHVLRRFKSCSRCVRDSRWWGSLTMVAAGNKTKRFLTGIARVKLWSRFTEFPMAASAASLFNQYYFLLQFHLPNL